ncbi:hypothetical protein NCAS_0A08740 [Naumovozyma castellii]|uniref:Mannan endo-1,6-alpha-mannosidase n=1 Tax=Naumovozyma castellii TaxID=27288 RepID=G0V7I4_NAUCA|nr:hypothetical protein NCAS_0A08740 [Naumovozyma castellii CBS 4309]CCC67432.1 hypothetical protein NCAS_0A08740 [Naumovozyma castellii CBS 4309]
MNNPIKILRLCWSLLLLSILSPVGSSIKLNVTSNTSICDATSIITKGILDYYEGTRFNGTVGMFQQPYYWWKAGSAFGGMLENWYLCQNDTFESLLTDAMLHQAGKDYDYLPENQTMVEANDDQGVWGLTIMGAVERNFTDPQGKDVPGWLAMAQSIFNQMYSRWDTGSCGGGLRWQIYDWNKGYNYKNTISTACLFQMAARLGRYTGNSTYLKVADKTFQWMVDIGYIQLNTSSGRVFDGAHIESNCSDITKLEWSYNHGIVLGGCAYMYNATKSPEWGMNTIKILNGATTYFFQNKTMLETACQRPDRVFCNNDQRTFKSIFSRMLGLTSVMAPFTSERIDPLIVQSAEAAALSCTGGFDNETCGLNWLEGKNDGYYGLGEQLSALEVIQNLLIHKRPPPYMAKTDKNKVGGVSKGDPAAGTKPKPPPKKEE